MEEVARRASVGVVEASNAGLAVECERASLDVRCCVEVVAMVHDVGMLRLA